jgi:hypothetical protein
MKKYAISFLFLILLVGCQTQENNLHTDAENVYLIIKTSVSENVNPTESEYEQLETFKSTYLENYKDYPSEQELLLEMESLVYSFNLKNVAEGLKKVDEVEMYQNSLDEAIKNLDKQFNK